MYDETLCESTAPTFATAAVSDADLASMHEFLEEVYRNEAAITEAEIIEMERLDRQAQQPQPKNETRVSVAGRRYRAEAKVAGGRWVGVGLYSTEAAAWQAASGKLAAMTGGERRTA